MRYAIAYCLPWLRVHAFTSGRINSCCTPARVWKPLERAVQTARAVDLLSTTLRLPTRCGSFEQRSILQEGRQAHAPDQACGPLMGRQVWSVTLVRRPDRCRPPSVPCIPAPVSNSLAHRTCAAVAIGYELRYFFPDQQSDPHFYAWTEHSPIIITTCNISLVQPNKCPARLLACSDRADAAWHPVGF